MCVCVEIYRGDSERETTNFVCVRVTVRLCPCRQLYTSHICVDLRLRYEVSIAIKNEVSRDIDTRRETRSCGVKDLGLQLRDGCCCSSCEVR